MCVVYAGSSNLQPKIARECEHERRKSSRVFIAQKAKMKCERLKRNGIRCMNDERRRDK